MELNDNYFIFAGILSSGALIFYCCYMCIKNRYNRNIINIDIRENPLEYSMVIDDTISNNIIHQNPIPPSYKEVDDDLIPPHYKE
jgi:hypothetical protein